MYIVFIYSREAETSHSHKGFWDKPKNRKQGAAQIVFMLACWLSIVWRIFYICVPYFLFLGLTLILPLILPVKLWRASGAKHWGGCPQPPRGIVTTMALFNNNLLAARSKTSRENKRAHVATLPHCHSSTLLPAFSAKPPFTEFRAHVASSNARQTRAAREDTRSALAHCTAHDGRLLEGGCPHPPRES
jgi:hypothetical protein